ncbi:MAG: ammonia-forming cytochrome c nitrite reductase subunit c552 [Thermoplasmata archaeon]
MNLSAIVCGASCHQGEHHPYYDEWRLSGHADSLDNLRFAIGAAEDSCLECHSADYILANASSKPALETAKYGITCALCHDPHNAQNPRQLRWPSDELCAKCHNPEGALPGDPIYHPQSSMRDGRSGAPILGEPFMPDVECADCHMYQPNITGHSFRPKAEACVGCHSNYSIETAETQISDWGTQTWTVIVEVHETVVLSERAIEDAPGYGFSDSTIDIAVDLCNEANYSLSFVVADGSGGAHNPAFASALLNFSEDRSYELIALLTPGTVRGRVVDAAGTPVEGVLIEKDGKVWGTSEDNGTFEFRFAPGTHSFDLKLKGSSVGSMDSVVVGGQVANVGDIVATGEDLGALILLAVGIIILLSTIVVYLLFRLRKLGSHREED